jgi:hypothetical protein
MAAYAVNDYTFGPGTLAGVAADMETTLETLDSTTNPVRLINVFYNASTGQYEGILIADGT